MTKEDEKYMYWLSSVSGLGLSFMQRILERTGSAKMAAKMSMQDVDKAEWMHPHEKALFRHALIDTNWQIEWSKLGTEGILFYSYFHDSYPEALRHIDAPPKRLFVKGKLPEYGKISVAVVGARNCTPYGRDMARMFGYRLAAAGVSVVSGMALGIDGWSHQGALEGGGETYAVLGSGVMVCYPSCHKNLYESIQKHGGVISEFPVYARAKPNFFPMRNRIISGLADGLLVVEAREKSGSLITADAALDQGKDVFVIPGRIGDELSVGCNRLIRMGAVPVLSPNDILDYYGISVPDEKPNGNETQQRILAYIGGKTVHINEIAAGLALTETQVLKDMIVLERKGYVVEVGRNFFMKKI